MRLLSLEVLAYWRGQNAPAISMGCYIILIFLMGYAAQHEPSWSDNQIPQLAFQWIALIVSSLLGLERIWHDDWRDGVLLQQRLSHYPLWLFSLIKVLAFWLSVFLPLLILFGGLQFLTAQLPDEGMLAMILATLCFSLLMGLAGALTLGSSGSSILISFLILLPLMIPALTFGMGTQIALFQDKEPWSPLALLGAYTLFTVLLAPMATSYILQSQRP